jgi:hypothetical protein
VAKEGAIPQQESRCGAPSSALAQSLNVSWNDGLGEDDGVAGEALPDGKKELLWQLMCNALHISPLIDIEHAECKGFVLARNVH